MIYSKIILAMFLHGASHVAAMKKPIPPPPVDRDGGQILKSVAPRVPIPGLPKPIPGPPTKPKPIKVAPAKNIPPPPAGRPGQPAHTPPPPPKRKRSPPPPPPGQRTPDIPPEMSPNAPVMPSRGISGSLPPPPKMPSLSEVPPRPNSLVSEASSKANVEELDGSLSPLPNRSPDASAEEAKYEDASSDSTDQREVRNTIPGLTKTQSLEEFRMAAESLSSPIDFEFPDSPTGSSHSGAALFEATMQEESGPEAAKGMRKRYAKNKPKS